MDILYSHCAGLDVHKDSVVACIRHANPHGPAHTQVRTFATVTHALPALPDWLLAEGVTQVAMESTGVYCRSRRIPFGNRWLRQALVQAAWSAGRTRDTYLSSQYRALSRRRGRKRAAVAVAHTLLVISYHLLKRKTMYQDLGASYLERLAPERLTSQLVRRLERWGHKITLEPIAAA